MARARVRIESCMIDVVEYKLSYCDECYRWIKVQIALMPSFISRRHSRIENPRVSQSLPENVKPKGVGNIRSGWELES